MSLAEATTETSLPSAETHLQGEQLYNSFKESLQLVRAIERKYSCAVLHLQPAELKQIETESDIDQVRSVGDRLRSIYYGEGAHHAQYDSIIERSLSAQMEAGPGHYEALEDPELRTLAKRMVRLGMLSQLRQKQVDAARVQRHHERNGSSAKQPVGRSDASIESSQTDELIAFNHLIRDTIEDPNGRRMNLDREKVRELLRIVMPGRREETDGIEEGLALEVATKHLIETLIVAEDSADAVKYGNIKEDKVGGDIILFPGTDQQVLIDVKKSPPNKLRKILSDESMQAPGSHWETNSKAILWLGSDGLISGGYGTQPNYKDTVAHLLNEATAYGVPLAQIQ